MAVKKRPYWMRKPTGPVKERLREITGLLRDEVRTVRNITYKMYPETHGDEFDNKYNTTVKDVVRARVRGIVPWSRIREERINFNSPSGWDSLGDYKEYKLEDFGKYYSRNKRPSHKRHIECWFEKDTVTNEFEEVCGKYDIPYVATRGQATWTFKRNSTRRLNNKENPIILYFGDNDDKGHEIFDVIRRDMKYLGYEGNFKWAAVTREQEQRYDLPRNSRIDTLNLEDLKEIIERQVRGYIDLDKYLEIVEKEKLEKERLEDLKLEIT